MASPLREFEEWCRSPEAAAMAAEIGAEVNAPGYVPREVAWLDAGPDPFGIGWEWLEPEASTPVADSRPAAPTSAN